MSKFQDRIKEEKAKRDTFEKLGLNSVMQSAVNDGIQQGIDFTAKLILEYYDKAKVETLNKQQMEQLLELYKEMAKKNFA
jgi:tagatose-1,6-bisphosphate aldolase non-catalytic subunit AgaZ/GatZ